MTAITLPMTTGYDLCEHYQAALRTIGMMRAVDDDEIILDMDNVDWVTPTFVSPVALECNRLRKQGKQVATSITDSKLRSYLNQIQFPTGTADPLRSYLNHLPICRLADGEGMMLAGTVAKEIRKLLKRNYTDLDGIHLNALTYPIDEIVGNVEDHSLCDFGTVLLQNYPARDTVDICIADNGVSIPGSFDDHGIEYDSDEDAVRKAAVDGISTRVGTDHETGLGLRSTADLVCSGTGGEMLLSSGDCTLHRRKDGSLKSREMGIRWPGTVFSARLEFPLSDDFSMLDYYT